MAPRELPSDGNEEFTALLDRARAGSEEAARQLVELCQPRVLHAVRKRLPRKLRSKFDSLDLTQEVWAAFFARVLVDCQCRTPDELNAYLWHMAQRKTIELCHQRYFGHKRDASQEHAMESTTVRQAVQDLAAPDPSPSRAAATSEQWQRMVHGANRQNQRILVLLRQGLSYRQIAKKCGINERSVRRVVQRLANGDSV